MWDHPTIDSPRMGVGGSAPAILVDLKHADMTKGWDVGVAQLLKAIR